MSDRAPSPAPAPEPPTQQAEVKREEESALPSPTASVAHAEEITHDLSLSPSRQRRTEAQRRVSLRDDPQIQVLEPRRVLCRSCEKWIKLSGSTTYAPSNWLSHKKRCTFLRPSNHQARSKPSHSPSSRVATLERKIVLLNDPQVNDCSPVRVTCGNCKSDVKLEGKVDYDLAKWTEHKEKCIPVTPARPITPHGSSASYRPRVFPPLSASSSYSHVSAFTSPRSPTPVAESSSETTAVTEISPVVVKTGVKRRRDEEESALDARPTNRPRTEENSPPQQATPGLFRRFLLPLQEFARGFREGLGTT